MMKFIAYYLPQFHEVKENNEWWGNGFTEWTNVKKSKALFDGHQQPKIPLDGYYDLMEKETMVKQAEYAEKYGIYGMAFYHYWFEGRHLLEKPAENLLKWKDINMNFMFCWANHDWIRSWNGTKELLLKQSYGKKKDWEDHFNYLLPFFKDPRYIKIDGKPAFGIYMIEQIPNVEEMIEMWNALAQKNGLPGVYIIEHALTPKYKESCPLSDAVIIRQPNMAMFKFCRVYNLSKRFKKIQPVIPNCYPLKIQYKKVMDNLIEETKRFNSNKTVFYGFFTGWDNTPRHGKRGSVIINQNSDDFKYYLHALVKLAQEKKVDYVFINAWNEWCEGMYLEPDKYSGNMFLNAIKSESFQ